MANISKKLRIAVRNPGLAIKFIMNYVSIKINHGLTALSAQFWCIIAKLSKKGNPIPIKHLPSGCSTQVDSFWAEHTVIGSQLASVKTAYQDKRYLKWRFSVYPLFKELMQLWGNHDGQVVLDYGCGPGNDLVGFLVYTNARKVIGIDISEKALEFASRRLALHRVDPDRVELIHISDSATTLPIDDNSVDYIYCEGVLHHTTSPEATLREFHRVLKPGSQACVMVYNCDSVYLHLYIAYNQMVLQSKFSGMNIYDAFAKTTDTEECPIARCYKAHEFISTCKDAGFSAEYVGGYLSLLELDLLKQYRQSALQDKRLGEEHKDFLRSLTLDERGFLKYEGKHAGIGGVYRLYKG
jgi:ubiquinone/menaquinone biosynthesis C-methylase UbiE